MKQHPKRTLFVNIFGGLGYFCCVLLWAWVGIIYTPILLENPQIQEFLLPSPTDTPVQPATPGPASPYLLFVGGVVSVLLIIATIIVLLQAPITIAKTGKSVTTKAARSAIPIVTHGKPIAPAKKKRLTIQLVKLVKLLCCIVPVIGIYAGAFTALPLPLEIITFIGNSLAISAIFWFSLQYLFARLLAVAPDQLV